MRSGLFYANLLIMESIVLRDQIVRKISKDLSISQARSKTMVEALESIIASELKVKSRIKIAHFGTFVVKTRASRTVKTVREQKTKIILQQEVIRFIAANQFKDQLMGKVSTNRSPNVQSIDEKISINIQTKENQAETSEVLAKQTPKHQESTKIIPVQRPKPEAKAVAQTALFKPKTTTCQPPHQLKPQIEKTVKPTKKIAFSPLSIYSRIERAKVESEIANRLIKLAKSLNPQTNKIETPYMAKTHEKVFASFIAQATKLKVKSLDFSLPETRPDKIDQTVLCAGRPRIRLGKIPTLVLYQFVSEIADIDTFQIPQHRFVTIKKPDNIKKVALEIHSFPTHQGASIHIGIL